MMVAGIIFGFLISYFCVGYLIRNLAGDWSHAAWTAAALGLLPGLYLGVVIGGNFGGAYAARFAESAILIGAAFGLALVMVFTVVLFVFPVFVFRVLRTQSRFHNGET